MTNKTIVTSSYSKASVRNALIVLAVAIVVLIASYIGAKWFITSLGEGVQANKVRSGFRANEIVTELPITDLATSSVIGKGITRADESVEQVSAAATAYPEPLPPIQAEVRNTELGSSTLVLWQKPAGQSDEVYAQILRADNVEGLKGSSAVIAEVTNDTEYVDTTVATGKQYVYAVRSARNVNGKVYTSANSNPITLTVSDTVAPASPSGVTVVPESTTNGAIRVRWQASVDGDTAMYRVYRSTRYGERGDQLTEVDNKVSEFLDTKAQPGVVYYYIVTAIDAAKNESSNTLSYSRPGNAQPMFIDTSN